MANFDSLLRPNLQGARAYGAPSAAGKLGLNVNENPYSLSKNQRERLLSALSVALTAINRYPDRELWSLRDSLASYASESRPSAHFSPQQVWAANGSNEILMQVLQAFGGPEKNVLGFGPTYSMHSTIAQITQTGWINGGLEAGFQLGTDHVLAQIREFRPEIVLLCAPNNPTGTPISLDTIRLAYEETQGLVLVDEAYVEFRPPGTPTAAELLPGRERLLIARTLSKAFSFAGGRVGYLLADQAAIEALQLVRLPYHLSSLTQAAAVAALEERVEILKTVEKICFQRERLLAELPELGYSALYSEANFVLFGGIEDSSKLFNDLFDHGIVVRDVGISNHLRVTAGTESETTSFLETLAKLKK